MLANLKLALAAAAAVSAAAVPTTSAIQKPKVPVSADVYANLAKYPAYTTDAMYLYFGPCTPPDGSVLLQYINNTQTDTQAALYRHDGDKEIILGIPGTNSTQDYLTDLTVAPVPYVSDNIDCPLCLVHLGFLTAWNSIAQDVQTGIRAALASYPDYDVIVAGHSLGGAICSLAYATLTTGNFPVKSAYCSGSPRVGDIAYANYIDKLSGADDVNPGNYYRITHFNDGVPQLPPFGVYVHPRTEYWESTMVPALNTTYRCFGQEPLDCNDSALGVGINAAHSTYAGIDYICPA